MKASWSGILREAKLFQWKSRTGNRNCNWKRAAESVSLWLSWYGGTLVSLTQLPVVLGPRRRRTEKKVLGFPAGPRGGSRGAPFGEGTLSPLRRYLKPLPKGGRGGRGGVLWTLSVYLADRAYTRLTRCCAAFAWQRKVWGRARLFIPRTLVHALAGR